MEKLDYPALGEAVWHEVLPNGLPIYVNERPRFGKQFAFFAVNYGGMDFCFQGPDGARQDTPAGIAHFLEHKLFDTPDGGNALQIMAANGADNNAFTSSSLTGYYFEGSRGFEENLETLLSFVSTPYFTRQSVDKEQGIIAQEIRMGEDDPDTAVYYMLLESLYKSHPIRVKVAGSEQSIAQITPEELYACHRTFYQPGNMVLCAAGNVEARKVADIARRVLPEQGAPRHRRVFDGDEPEGAVRRRAERTMAVSAPLFEIGFKGAAPEQGGSLRQRLVGELVCDALFSSSAPLYQRLYEQGLINESFSGSYESMPGCALLSLGGESREPERVLECVLEEAERVGREGLDPALWERQKKAAYGQAVRQLNSLEATCMDLAMGCFEGEDYLRFPEAYRDVQRADGEEMIRSWCTEERSALAVIRPAEETA